MVDGGMVLEFNKISTTTDALYISSLDTINFMGGQIVMDKEGNLTVDGNLTVAGKIEAVNGIETTNINPPTGKDLSINLANASQGEGIGEQKSSFGKLLVKGTNNETVASVDSIGNAEFAGNLHVGSLSLPADYKASESSNIRLIGSPSKNGQTLAAINTSGTTGLGIIPAGQTQLLLYNFKVTDKSLIYLTPLTSTSSQSLYVSEKVAGEYFKVAIDRPLSQDIKFNWWILEGR